jgi:putative nucleotidyltransferase with HDIG domain
LTAAIDTKDHYTFNHSKNVAYYAGELARAYGMNENCIEIVKEAGLLHDVGKIGIPENILNKPGRLSSEEYEVMKTHVENSIGIIRHLPSLDYVIPAVLGHHERYDGKGYPDGSREKTFLMARILCWADSFDA